MAFRPVLIALKEFQKTVALRLGNSRQIQPVRKALKVTRLQGLGS
ncbi:MAG: hypothetical protein JWQ71_2341 [Pedosphaera sp.]|nr:hypothetical protein [Pedosphaera sp.]